MVCRWETWSSSGDVGSDQILVWGAEGYVQVSLARFDGSWNLCAVTQSFATFLFATDQGMLKDDQHETRRGHVVFFHVNVRNTVHQKGLEFRIKKTCTHSAAHARNSGSDCWHISRLRSSDWRNCWSSWVDWIRFSYYGFSPVVTVTDRRRKMKPSEFSVSGMDHLQRECPVCCTPRVDFGHS